MADRPKVAPYLTVSPASAAIAFYVAVFNAKQRAFMPSLDGLRISHCELEINGGSVMLADAFPELGQVRAPIPGELATASVSLELAKREDVDAIFTRATGMGARGEVNPLDTFWGTRFAVFRDPFGQRWMLNAPLRA